MSAKGPRVFITQNVPYRNVTGALSYGSIVTMLPAGSIHTEPQKLLSHFNEQFNDFDWKRDFLLPMGDPMGMGLAIAAALEQFPYVNILRYNRDGGTYTACRVSL